MLEVWTCKEQPAVQLVISAGGTMPAELGQGDWKLAGPFVGSAEVAAQVAEKGYQFIAAGPASSSAPGELPLGNPAKRPTDFR